jgi:hypothetical protein
VSKTQAARLESSQKIGQLVYANQQPQDDAARSASGDGSASADASASSQADAAADDIVDAEVIDEDQV